MQNENAEALVQISNSKSRALSQALTTSELGALCGCVCPTRMHLVLTGWAYSFQARKLEIYLLKDLAAQLDLEEWKEL